MNAALLSLIEAQLNDHRPAYIRPHPRIEHAVLVEAPLPDGKVESAMFTHKAVRAAARNGWRFVTKENLK